MSEKEAEAQLERDEQITAGKYSVSELETLRLQKLMYQNNIAAKEFQHLQEMMKVAHEKTQKAQSRFLKELDVVKDTHGLEKWHDIQLSDEDGGIVFVDEKLKAERDAKAKEDAEKQPEEDAPAAEKQQLEEAESK